MEVMEGPLNLAHQQGRRADRLLAAGKYEEAISCHEKAAAYLSEAMKLTQSEQAHLSLELQRDSHRKQLLLIQERWKRAQREQRLKTSMYVHLQASHKSSAEDPEGQSPLSQKYSPSTEQHLPGIQEIFDRDPETLLYLLQQKSEPAEPCMGSKAEKARLLKGPIEKELDVDAEFVETSELWSLLPHSETATISSTWQKFAANTGKGKDISIPSLSSMDFTSPELPHMELPEEILKGFISN
uniref:Nuclear receptor binding factor 2 n=1 Tax=Saimiri boliviensis boliviensis TaxID=39432 RepID=A0A2K6V5F5_SAIBB